MNTREQVELDTILTELRGEIAGLKKRVAQLEARKTNNHPSDCVCNGCLNIIPAAWQVTYIGRNTKIATSVYLVYKLDHLYKLVQGAPAGHSIEINPMDREDLVRPDDGDESI